jgi:hypothetical protein
LNNNRASGLKETARDSEIWVGSLNFLIPESNQVLTSKAGQMADKTAPDDELFIHLDLAGLAALMKAVEAAIATGRGPLKLGSGGIKVSGGAASFARVTLTFSDPGGGGLALAA